jgi:nucleoside-diphosphate-sugar epimerase
LITGADGYVGGHVAARLLNGDDDRLLLAVRAADPAEFALKQQRLAHRLGRKAEGRVAYLAFDVRRDDDGFRDLDPLPVTRIVHAAAATRLNVDYDLARSVNVAGTARMLDWAHRCPVLQRFAFISTLYAAGRLRGAIAEEPLPDAGFVNNYEWSKWAAEQIVLDAATSLPVSVLRLPTLVADDDTGQVTQYNAFHNTLKLLFYGLLSLLPGDPSAPVPVATASFVSSAIVRLLDPVVPNGIFHVCHDSSDTTTLGRLIDTAFTAFEGDERFRRRGLVRPVYYDRGGFADLLENARLSRGTSLSESLDSVATFAEQLYLAKDFGNKALRAHWPAYAASDPAELTATTTKYLVATRWGRQLKEIA